MYKNYWQIWIPKTNVWHNDKANGKSGVDKKCHLVAEKQKVALSEQ